MARNHKSFRQIAALGLAGLLAAGAWFAWTRHLAEPAGPAGAPDAPPGGRPTRVYYGPANSLAVLPFEDQSAAQDQGPQARAFAADLLDRFVAATDAQVAARSSAFFFRNAEDSPRIIAERLQHAHLLRGGWRRNGDSVRLAVSLFDARAGRETWSREYERPISGLSALLDSVVADTLGELPGVRAAGLTAQRGIDPDAWTDYALGMDHADPLGAQDLLQAAADFRAAIDQDPGFAAGRLALAELWLHPGWPRSEGGTPAEDAREALRQVLEGHPRSARALALLSHIRHQYDWDWEGALAAGREAVEAEPGNPVALSVASLAAFTVGDFEQSQQWLEASLRRDPLNLGSRLRMGLLQEFRGDYEAALSSYRQILVLYPEYPAAHAYRARVKALQGKPASALEESDREASPFWRRYSRILALLAKDSEEEARPSLEAMIAEEGETASFQIAEILAFGGDPERAFAWLQHARDRRDPGLAALLGNPLLRGLQGDPRWAELLGSVGLAID